MTQPPTTLEEALALIPPEKLAELEAQAQTEALFARPAPLPTQWSFEQVQLSDGSKGVIVTLRQPNSMQRILFSTESAREFASGLRKMASGLVEVPALVVPGR